MVETLTRYVAADPLDRHSRLALAEIFRRMGRHELSGSTLAALPAEDRQANVIRVQNALDQREIELADRLLALGRADDPALALLRGAEASGLPENPDSCRAISDRLCCQPPRSRDGFWPLGRTRAPRRQTESAANPRSRPQPRSAQLIATAWSHSHSPPGSRAHPRIRGLCEALHRDDEARAWFHLAIAANPTDKEAQQALFRIQSAAFTQEAGTIA